MRVRRQTGIENWNVLCRWAFCASVREELPPPSLVSQKFDGGVEMTWKVFAGEQSEIFKAVTIIKAIKDNFPLTQEGIANCFRAHLHRGLGYLASGKDTKSIATFVARWIAFDTER